MIGVAVDENGKGLLRVAVAAIPEDGKANKALVEFLAKQWRIAKSKIALVSGAKDRLKILHIDEGDAGMIKDLENWVAHLTPAPR